MVAAASLGVAPGIRIRDGVIILLAPDAVFQASLELPGVFRSFVGALDATGSATGTLAIPMLPGLSGRSLQVAFLTQHAGLLTTSAAASTRLRDRSTLARHREKSRESERWAQFMPLVDSAHPFVLRVSVRNNTDQKV